MENLGNFIKSAKSSKLDYSTAVANKEKVCKILGIEPNCTHTQFKNSIRYKFVSALPELSKNVEAVKLAKQILKLTGFKVVDFKKWLSTEQINEISKTIK